jgi:DNA polymerase-1
MARDRLQKSFFDGEAEDAAPSEAENVPAIGQPLPPAPLPETGIAEPPPEDLAGKTVYVVDSHSLIHQVFHALPEMTSPKGEPVGAVFGFARDLFFLLESKQPDYLFCAFDLPGKTFRHELYADYKLGRPEMDVDLAPQFDSIRRLLEAMGIPALGCPGREADDILATIARLTAELQGDCFLVTGDKDCRQLINPRVKVYNIRKNQVYDEHLLAAEWGVRPEQVVDFQALVGDATDHVPGVPLIGPKAAQQLLAQYGTLEEVLAHAQEVTGAKKRENLVAFAQQALLSRQLVRLDVHTPVAVDWNAGRVRPFDRTGVARLLAAFGFRSMAAKVDALAVAEVEVQDKPGPAYQYHLVDTPAAFAEFLGQLRQQKWFSFDTETTNIWPRWAEIVGYSFAWNAQEAWYLPVRAPAGEKHLDPAETLAALRPILEDETVGKIGQNLKYDMVVLRSAGVEMRGLAFDTMIASYLLEAGQRTHNLDDLAKRYLNHTTIKISELIGSGKNQKRMDEVPTRLVADYAGEDALLPVLLRPLLETQLEANGLQPLLLDTELPLVEVLAELEFNGIRVDTARLAELSQRYGQRMALLEQAIFKLAGREFNLSSPKQLQEILFKELQLPVVKKTKTGPSTDVEVLEELAPLHALPARIIDFRQYAKLKSTYVDALPQMVFPGTGRVHTSFKQDVAATGRLSSSDPNLQNIPVRTEESREIRSAFVPGEPGWLLLAADYSQIELRVLAHFSGDTHLCEAFARDQDVHARVASEVSNVPLEEVTEAMRRQAKIVNFGVIYGQSAFGLAKQLGIDQTAAAAFIDAYFQKYAGVEKFLNEILAGCRARGYVNTILGRRRAIEGVREFSGRQRNLAERTAINTVIQGSAADLIKLAMLAVHRRLRRERLAARMLLQIHDELVFEVPSDQLDYLAKLVTEEMVNAATLRVPLKVDVQTGPNWADVQSWS